MGGTNNKGNVAQTSVHKLSSKETGLAFSIVPLLADNCLQT